jgi:SAM-dependent methyltransferase
MGAENELIQADRPCPITGDSECEIVATKAREGHPLRNVMSAASGIIYVDPLPIEDLAEYYRDEYRKTYKKIVVPKPKHIYRAGSVALDRMRHAGEEIRSGLRTLDIGAGGGEWVYLMKRLGCDSYGVEPNQGYGTFARDSYDVDVFLGMYQDSVFERESFDVLTLFQVLEHLAEPVKDLRQMAEYLKPGGRFLIEVPDILFPGMHFNHKWHDGHLYGFDELTLEAVAAKAGLRKVSLQVLPGNLFGVFEKSDEDLSVPASIEGHYPDARRRLFEGRAKYWTLPNTYLKVPRRLRKRVEEKRVSSSLREPRAILDHHFDSNEAVQATREEVTA